MSTTQTYLFSGLVLMQNVEVLEAETISVPQLRIWHFLVFLLNLDELWLQHGWDLSLDKVGFEELVGLLHA